MKPVSQVSGVAKEEICANAQVMGQVGSSVMFSSPSDSLL